jgi:hypothetical protein
LGKKNQITQDMGLVELGLHNTRLQVVAWVIHNLLILVTDMEGKKEKEGAVCAAAIIQITYQQLI